MKADTRLNNIGRIGALSLLCFLLLSVTSCRMGKNDNSIYHDIPTEGWRYGDVLRYDLELEDSVVNGSLDLAMRHTNDYIYSNLYLEVTLTDRDTVCVDTLNLRLADDFGRWYGSGIGTDFQLSTTLRDNVRLHAPASVEVRHIMRDELLRDIEQVGITFTQDKE